ncbi:unnamed protein product [Schistosoma intercalatum]|nr:unnamed protein product [Schistosoma intercalatum]CAH8652908.1 unnamed protein product [Schistosoma intercalatum]
MNYLIIPGIDKFKTIESETMKHIKEFTEITTEHKKYDHILPLSNVNDNNHNHNHNTDNDKSQFDINKFINPNQNKMNDYSVDLSMENKQIENLSSNEKLNELNHQKYDISPRMNQKQVNNSDLLLYKYSHQEQDKVAANNNNNPYVSKHVDIQSNEEFLYNKQIIKSRQSSSYIILRPRKMK